MFDIHFLISLVIWLVIMGGIIYCIRMIPGLPPFAVALATIVVILIFLARLADSIGGSGGRHFLGCG